MSQNHIQEHIDLIARHEQEFLEQRTQVERVGDSVAGFVGSLSFVSVHLLVFVGWMGWNVMAHVPHFDPAPFSLLGTLLAMEAIILASLILMRQARMSRRADERDHLMLQILLLTEKELTASLNVDRKIAQEMGLADVAQNPELRELSKHTSIEDVAQTIRESLPPTE